MLPAGGKPVTPLQRPGRSPLHFFLALFLICGYAQKTLGQAPGQASSADFDALVKSATAAREAGKPDDAIRDYRHALEIHPSWDEGWWYLGTLLYDGDHFAEAIPAFQNLVQLLPGAGPAWNFLGLCEFEIKDYGNSLEHLKKGQALGDGDDPEIARVSKFHLALLLNRAGDFAQAAALLTSTFAQSQMSPQVKLALGISLLRVPLLPEEIDPSQDALIHAVGEAASALAQNDSAKALAAFPSLLKDYPAIPYLHYAYGKTLASAARYEEALAQQREESSGSPKSAWPRIEISLLQLRLQHPQEALRAAEEAVQLAPDSAAAHRALAQVLQALGKKEKAGEEIAVAEKLSHEMLRPDDAIARRYTRHSEASAGRETQAAANQPNGSATASFEELSRRAAAAQTSGNPALAMQNYQQALQLRPDWDDGRWNLAMLAFSSARYPEAISALKAWVEHKPNFGAAWAVMGLSEFETKDYGNALIHLQRGTDLGLGGSAESVRLAKYRLAILLNRNGQFERATEILAPESAPGPLVREIQFALGMALLRMPVLPEQVEAANAPLVQTAGEIAALLQNSKYDQAFPKFHALLKEYPSAPFLHYAFGTALAALSRYDEAEKEFRKELQISPASELPYVRLASMALKKHLPADALPSARHAVQLAPDSAEAHYLLGRSSLELGHEESAVQELEVAGKLAPGSPEVHFNLAKAYAKAKMPEKAEQERAIFARLNALAEKQRSLSGNQAYGGSRRTPDAAEFTPPVPR